MLTLNEYHSRLKEILKNLFAEKKIEDEDFDRVVAKAIVDCFHLPQPAKLSEIDQTKCILEHLFVLFSIQYEAHEIFRLSVFIKKFIKNKKDLKPFLTSILYGFYLGDLQLSKHQVQSKRENLELFMLQLLMEKLSKKAIRDLIGELSLEEQTTLICYAYKNYREGSYAFLNKFEEMLGQKNALQASASTRKLLTDLMLWLNRKYFDISLCYLLLNDLTAIDEDSLQVVINTLEEHAKEQTRQCYMHFNTLIPLIISSPVRVSEDLAKLKQETNPDAKGVKQAQENLKKCFESFYKYKFSFEEFQYFARLYGLEGSPLLFQMEETSHREVFLVEKLDLLVKIFSQPLILLQMEGQTNYFFSFMLILLAQLEALHYNPSFYKKGLDRLACGIPTKGKLLASQPSVNSVVKGYAALINFFNTHFPHKILLKDYPLFVFDQSEETLFNQNRLFINRLNKLYKSSVIQVSQKEALALAKKIGIEPFLNTTETGSFGYGGARNCVFFLTPILRHAFAEGKCSLKDVLEMDAKELVSLFKQFVLGKPDEGTPCDDFIFMIDDDMNIPTANLFAHTFFVENFKSSNLISYGNCCGRSTKNWIFIPSLNDILYSTMDSFKSTRWIPFALSAGMSECVSKPKFCLNLPFGNEEKHCLTSYISNTILQTGQHLGGTRYPDKQLPTHSFVGLEDYLQKFIPYALSIAFVSDLLDPDNQRGRCVFPWNSVEFQHSFHTLGELFAFIAGEKPQKEMQKRFWKNIDLLFLAGQKDKIPLLNDLDHLIRTPIQEVLLAFQKEKNLTLTEKSSLKRIGDVYLFYQRDATLLWEFGSTFINEIMSRSNTKKPWFEECMDQSVDLTTIIDSIKVSIESKYGIQFIDYPLIQGFYQLLQVVGAGKFNQLIRKLLNSI